jgi:hypothetical protein
VRARPLAELGPSPGEERELAPRLREALESRSTEPLELPPDIPLAVLADALSSKLHLPQGAMEPIFWEVDIGACSRRTTRSRRRRAERSSHEREGGLSN